MRKIDDDSVTGQIKFALLSHKSTSALKAWVTTNERAVADQWRDRPEAEDSLVTQLAGDVCGVKSVTNRMPVIS